MRVHAIADAGGTLVASGAIPADGAGPRAQLGAGPGHTRHELELPSEFEGMSPREVHEKLGAGDFKQYIVAAQ
jgi:hypothetical protein